MQREREEQTAKALDKYAEKEGGKWISVVIYIYYKGQGIQKGKNKQLPEMSGMSLHILERGVRHNWAEMSKKN